MADESVVTMKPVWPKIIDTVFFGVLQNFQTFSDSALRLLRKLGAFIFIRSFILGGAGKSRTVTEHFGELPCVYAVAPASVQESSDTLF